MKYTVKVNSKSVENSGLPKDFNNSIAEFIWNSLDAQATEVEIIYKKNNLDGLEYLSVKDNGNGIERATLQDTFGLLLDSQKKKSRNLLSMHGNKGRGRFAFQSFAEKAVWKSIYKDTSDYFQYDIEINSKTKDEYTYTDPVRIQGAHTGTEVIFYDLSNMNIGALENSSFIKFLQSEFGWYLHLHRKKDIKILLNGKKLDYSPIFSATDEEKMTLETKEGKFHLDIDFIEWETSIGDEHYYYYFLDDEFNGIDKKTTRLNHNSIQFHHSVYVRSNFFNNYSITDDEDTHQMSILGKDQTFKQLMDRLHTYLETRQKEFVARNADTLVEKLEQDHVMPQFTDNPIEQEKRKDLIEVTKSIYKVQPRLFIKTAPIQIKSFLGLLNLVLNTNERQNILKIVEEVVENMTNDERMKLVKILEKTKLSRIVKTIKALADRFKAVEGLKQLVFTHSTYTNERDHIQKIMEQSFWLFGEQYHLVSDDTTFQTALRTYYVDILNRDKSEQEKFVVHHKDKNRRPDLFLARPFPINNHQIINEENIIVELKRPSTIISKVEYRQVQDYMDLIINQSSFNGDSRLWKFFMIGVNIDDFIKSKIRDNQQQGSENYLVEKLGNYRMYAMKWDDVFLTFNRSHSFIIDNLDFDREAIVKELETEGVSLAKDFPSAITKKILDKKR